MEGRLGEVGILEPGRVQGPGTVGLGGAKAAHWMGKGSGIAEQTPAGVGEIAANGYLFRIAGNPTFGIFTGFRISASVAQLAEQRFCKPQVVGSSPSAGS